MTRWVLRWSVPLLLAAMACKAGEPPVRAEDLRGPRLTRAIPKPALQLTRDDGTPLDLRAATAGTLTFLFFGYTYCPDVCPLHMANLAGALKALPKDVSERVRVVFVTTDPERDTPQRLGSWLAHFDSTFIGARGADDVVAEAQRGMGMPVSSREGLLPDSSGYAVSHGAHLWAFTPDDSAHVVYPMGMTKDDLASDIPKLLRLYGRRR